jgi:hypothetical protein
MLEAEKNNQKKPQPPPSNLPRQQPTQQQPTQQQPVQQQTVLKKEPSSGNSIGTVNAGGSGSGTPTNQIKQPATNPNYAGLFGVGEKNPPPPVINQSSGNKAPIFPPNQPNNPPQQKVSSNSMDFNNFF